MGLKQTGRRRAVAMCSDLRGMPYALFVASTLAGLYPQRGFDIVLASDHPVAVPPAFADLGIVTERLRPPAAELAAANDPSHALPVQTYLRLWLADALRDRYDRVLYLDIDVLVQGGDLDRLMAVDLHGHPCAGVRDLGQWRDPLKPILEFALAGVQGTRYMNSGVMLIDTDAWIAAEVTPRILAQASRLPRRYTADQGLFNLAQRGAWAELSPVWNWHMTRNNPVLLQLVSPNIVHYAGTEKPWDPEKGRRVCDRTSISAYARFLGRHFPDRAAPVLEREEYFRHQRRPWSELLAAAFQYRSVRRYLSRFPDDYATLP